MTALFRTVLNMSITGSWVILAVLLARLLLKRAPKSISYALWAVAGFRLCCPISFEAVFSLFRIPHVQTGSAVTHSPAPVVQTTAPAAPSVMQPTVTPAAPAFSWMGLFAILWAVGLAALLAYTLLRDLHLRRKLRTAIREQDNIWRSESVISPFIFGILRPRIYLPYGLTAEQEAYVLRHERCHLKRMDHIIKLVGFLILAVHWFNPLCHVAFHFFCRDMEMSCDEQVLGEDTDRKEYSTTLVSIAAGSGLPLPTPLSFGETAVKARVKNILRWKKGRWYTVLPAILLCVVVILACAADPIAQPILKDGTYLGITTPTEDFNLVYTVFYKAQNGSFTMGDHTIDLADSQWEDPPFAQAQWENIIRACSSPIPGSIEGCRYLPLLSETVAGKVFNGEETVPADIRQTIFLLKSGNDIYLCGFSEYEYAESHEPVTLTPYVNTTVERLILVGSKDDPLTAIFPQLDSLAKTVLSAPGTPEAEEAYTRLLRSRHAPFYICDVLNKGQATGEKGELIARLYGDILQRRKEEPRVERGDLTPEAWINASLQAYEAQFSSPFPLTLTPLQMIYFQRHYTK